MSNTTDSQSLCPPTAAGRHRSQSLSSTASPPLPLSVNTASPLSPASLRFSELSLSPSSLHSDQFKKAYHHARSASFGGSSASSGLGINTNVSAWASRVDTSCGNVGLSTSPTSTLSSVEDRLLTPTSSPTRTYPTPPASTKASSNSGRATSLKGAEGVIHEVHEGDEHADGIDIVNPPASSAIFSNGARWGWPQQTSSVSATAVTSGSPPSVNNRRASLGIGQPNSTYGMTAPLGRVSSAGATMGTSGGKTEPFGIFRRLSVGGFGGKVRYFLSSSSANAKVHQADPVFMLPQPKAPSPPPLVVMSAPIIQEPQFAKPVDTVPVSTSEPSAPRGRRASVSSTKPKRKISPNGLPVGLGLHTTLQLALRGATVLAGAHSIARAAPALDALMSKHPEVKGRIKIFEMDLSSFESSKEAAETALALTERLDGLVNNAARLTQAGPYEISKEGIEMIAQVNHFGTYIFTKTLLPLLIKTSKEPDSDVRIVTLGSVAQGIVGKSWSFTGPETFNEIFSKPSNANAMMSGFKRYGASKIYNVLWTAELQRHFDADGVNIIATVVHPGAVATRQYIPSVTKAFFLLTRYSLAAEKNLDFGFPIGLIARLFFTHPSNGAKNSLFALTSPEVKQFPELYKGKYLEPYGKVVTAPPGKAAEDPVAAKRLWEVTEEIIARGGLQENGDVVR
ncbi:hypothetical protein P7C70_g4982, partial [Phenoliferia sp. Uapishka_3]